jgi:hypothetical protein
MTNEIKQAETTKVEIKKTITLYCCTFWENGVVYSNHPSPSKESQEQYLLKISSLEGIYNCQIYAFEVYRPTIN